MFNIATKIVIKIFSSIYKCYKVDYIVELIAKYNNLNVVVGEIFFASILNNIVFRLQFIKNLENRYLSFCDKNIAKLFKILQKSRLTIFR